MAGRSTTNVALPRFSFFTLITFSFNGSNQNNLQPQMHQSCCTSFRTRSEKKSNALPLFVFVCMFVLVAYDLQLNDVTQRLKWSCPSSDVHWLNRSGMIFFFLSLSHTSMKHGQPCCENVAFLNPALGSFPILSIFALDSCSFSWPTNARTLLCWQPQNSFCFVCF